MDKIIIPYNKPSSAGQSGMGQYNSPLSSHEYMLFSDLMAQPAYYIDKDALNPRNFIKPINSPVSIPPPPPNGGLYGGPQSNGPWANIPIVPEMHIYMANLASANPPPNAMNQIIGTNRLGNNTLNMQNSVFYEPPNQSFNPYAIYVVK